VFEFSFDAPTVFGVAYMSKQEVLYEKGGKQTKYPCETVDKQMMAVI
jgi:hypothetical protein